MSSSPPRSKSVHIEVSHLCNERCLHCFLSHEDRATTSHSSLPSIIHFDTILHKLVSLEFLMLCLTGYEPLLNPHLPELIVKARKRHFFVRVKSNGLALDLSLLEELRRAGLGAIDFSLYSAEPGEHDRITQIPGSFERTIAAMHLCKKLKVPFRIGVVLFSPLPDMKRVMSLIKAFDVPHVIDPLVRDKFDKTGSIGSLLLSHDEMKQYLQGQMAIGHLATERLSPHALPMCKIGEGLYIDHQARFRFCPVSQRYLGSMLDANAEEVIVNHAAEVRVKVFTERECNRCDLSSFCSPCYELSWEETGDLCACSPTRRRYALAAKEVYEELHGKR